MNRDDARFVLDYLGASFPGQLGRGADSDDEVARRLIVWLEELARYERGHAMAAIARLRVERIFLPSHAEMRQAIDGERHRDEAAKGLAPGSQNFAPPEAANSHLVEIRAALAKIGRPVPRPAPVEPENRRSTRPPLPHCPEADHRYCGQGPIKAHEHRQESSR